VIALALLILAALCTIVAYITYYDQVVEESTRPNRWSWLIWSAATLVEALTYDAVNPDVMKALVFFISAGFCILLTLTIWRKSVWKLPTWEEGFCTFAVITALVVWFQFQQALLAHVIMVLAVPVSFLPTWRDAWNTPEHERPLAWALWSLGDFLTLLLILGRFETFENLPYIVVELGCHFMTWQIIVWRRNAKTRG
jgi:hypothetical protein